MPAIVTTAMRSYAAKQFAAGFSDSLKSHYIFVGRTLPWPDEDTAPMPLDAPKTLADTYIDMLHGKKLRGEDVSLVIPRFNWTAGTAYSQYADDVDFFDPSLNIPPFYVVTDQLNVYKCIANAGGVQSTDRPTHTNTALGTTSDGYKWKYMFTIAPADVVKFVTNEWIPIKTLAADDGSQQWQVQQAAVPGTIDRIDVIAQGTQYTQVPTINIIGECTTPAVATAVISNGNLIRIDLSDTGEGYRSATIEIVGGGPGANGAAAKAIISPQLGHGADPVAELGGFYTMIAGRFVDDEGGTFTVSNDFRRLGILMNPKVRGTSTLFSGSILKNYYSLTLGQVSGPGYNADEGVNTPDDPGYGTVLDYNDTTKVLRLIEAKGVFEPGASLVTGSTTGILSIDSGNIISATVVSGMTAATVRLPNTANATDDYYNGMTIKVGTQVRTITDYIGLTRTASVSANWDSNTAPSGGTAYNIANIVAPDIEPFTGDILYVENRRAIIRADQQSEQISLVVEF